MVVGGKHCQHRYLERHERGMTGDLLWRVNVLLITQQPSIFNGPEISMPRESIHYGGWEHRDLHNINGMLFVRATSVR